MCEAGVNSSASIGRACFSDELVVGVKLLPTDSPCKSANGRWRLNMHVHAHVAILCIAITIIAIHTIMFALFRWMVCT